MIAGTSAGRGLVASLLLLTVLVGTLLGEYFAVRIATLAAIPALVFYVLLEWRRLRGNAKALLCVCAILGVWSSIHTGSFASVLTGLERACFYPAFLAALGFLRDAAASSPMVDRAGRYLIDQPPARRYVALTVGGHLFGVLLNMGGLALLASMLKQANTLDSARNDSAVQALREKRMVLAVLRGFSAMPMWCPLSITMALLFSLLPQAHWSEYAPWGIGMTIVYMSLGWLYDFVFMPRARATIIPRDPKGWIAIAAMVAQVGVITLIALALERITGVRFLTQVLVTVPLFSLGWLVAQYWRGGSKLGPAFGDAVHNLARRSLVAFPAIANEVALFATSGFLGVMLATLVPRDALPHLLASLQMPVHALQIVMVLGVGALGFVGVNPMITITMILGSVAQSPIAGLSPLALILTLAGAWTLSLGLSPLNGSMVLLGNVVGRSSNQIALEWNGPFALATLALFCCALLLLPI